VVAVGMVAESRVALELGIADERTAERQEALIADWGLPTRASGVDAQRALQALRIDKKIRGGRLRMPLVPEIGRFELVEDVPLEIVERAMLSVLTQA